MDTVTIERILAPIILGVICCAVFFLIKPQKKEMLSAILTGLGIAFIDYILEIGAARLDLWHYSGKFLFLGLPPEMFIDITLVVTNICLGYVFFKRKGPRYKIGYVIILCVLLGSWGIYHNKKGIDMGLVTFSDNISFGTAWFIAGNFILLSLMILCSVFVFEWINKKKKG